MKKFFKWFAIIAGSLAVIGFLAFLYLIPPFDLLPPEEFVRQTVTAGPALDGITDTAERAIAGRGKYLVTSLDCSGCHTPQGDKGPNVDEYLAGGNKVSFRGYGTFISRNLTPDKETGLGRRSDEQVKRILRSGLLPEGRVSLYRDMPWAFTSNWTEEDRHAVMVYLRHLKPVHHVIAEPDTTVMIGDEHATETFFNTDFGHPKTGK